MTHNTNDSVNALIKDQLQNWDLAAKNYKGLKQVETRKLIFDSGTEIRIQFNPGRIRSSAAKVDAASIEARPCFLCQKNLPSAQRGVAFEEDYLVLVNPFPIFPRHLTIPHKSHIPQRIQGHLGDMMRLARALSDFVVFYNGPKCGASAPDHLHFQAGNKGFLPIEREFGSQHQPLPVNEAGLHISVLNHYLRKTLVLEGDDADEIEKWFNHIYSFLEKVQPGEDEPMLNILCSWEADRWRLFIFPRKEHRPRQFYAPGDAQILLSPASVDFGGVLITPRHEDFLKLNNLLVEDIFEQVTLGNNEWQRLKEVLTKEVEKGTRHRAPGNGNFRAER